MIPAVDLGLSFLESVGMDAIHARVSCLTGWLLDRLGELRHGNGRPVVQIYGPRDRERRGGAVALNFVDREGRLVDHQVIEERAGRRRISLRSGCFCNPGAGEMALGLSRQELATCFRGAGATMTYEDFRNCIDGKGSGAVRVSVGPVTDLADVEAFLALASEFISP
jgi:selenocysteine lyase/cysteine desulfurase